LQQAHEARDAGRGRKARDAGKAAHRPSTLHKGFDDLSEQSCWLPDTQPLGGCEGNLPQIGPFEWNADFAKQLIKHLGIAGV
jgi:hypothetical protein